MRINEIFPAIQGEGSTAGMPTTFVRLSGCNLQCKFCDTKYHINGKERTVKDVANEIVNINMPTVTVTGGEPLLQYAELKKLMKTEPTYGWYLETNGTIYKDGLEAFLGINCSPKKQGINTSSLKKLAKLSNISFKFVYESKDDLWWESLINECKISKENVYIMPEGADRATQLKRMPEVIEYCQTKGYNFSPRLHVLAYDKRRGV